MASSEHTKFLTSLITRINAAFSDNVHARRLLMGSIDIANTKTFGNVYKVFIDATGMIRFSVSAGISTETRVQWEKRPGHYLRS